MTKTGRKATAALMAALTMMVAGRASAQDEPIAATDLRETTIVLHVANYAALSRHVLDGAKARVTKVYEVIGVRTEWVDSAETVIQLHDGRLHLTVILLSRDMAQKKIAAGRISDYVLGQAHLASRRAYIFCDRIAAVPGAPTMFSISLGNVIAHEMGHLVLRANRHSPDGIMRANVDLHAMDLQGFNKSQASSIRTMLLELTAGVTGK